MYDLNIYIKLWNIKILENGSFFPENFLRYHKSFQSYLFIIRLIHIKKFFSFVDRTIESWAIILVTPMIGQ